MEPIITLLIMFAIIGVVAYVLITLVPMPAQIRTLIIVAAVLSCLLMMLRAVGGVSL